MSDIVLNNPEDALNFSVGPKFIGHGEIGSEVWHKEGEPCLECERDAWTPKQITAWCTRVCQLHSVVEYSDKPPTGNEHQCNEACTVDNCPCLEDSDGNEPQGL